MIPKKILKMTSIRERIIIPQKDISEKVRKFSDSINIPPVLGSLLVERGIDTFQKAKEYFRPSLDMLSDPFVMDGVSIGAKEICSSIDKKETIAVFGDYDVDGITSSALMKLALTNIGAEVENYLPNRFDGGYGLSIDSVEKISESKAKLIITVDCGITAHKEVERANQLGLKTIITDHHEPDKELPDALCIIDPKIENSGYPYKELAGVGVAFKLIQAVYELKGIDKKKAYEYLDLVALGSIADIVPLTGENRILAKYGLMQIKKTKNIGIKLLLREANLLDKELKTNHVVFNMAPMINSAGRIGAPQKALNLFVTDDYKEANSIVRELKKDNDKRKEIDRRVTEDAIAMAIKTVDFENDYVIVLASKDWHSGVIGIAASRLVEKFYKPVVLIALDENGMGKGSARSVPNFHLYNALSECSDYFTSFGGHKYAAGLSIDINSIENFRREINSIAARQLKEYSLVPEVKPCGMFELNNITARIMRLLELMEPFGPGNSRPIFYSEGIKMSGTPKVVGKKHVKFSVAQGGVVMDAIAFNMAGRIGDLRENYDSLGLAFGLEENNWNGNSSLQLRIKGINV